MFEHRPNDSVPHSVERHFAPNLPALMDGTDIDGLNHSFEPPPLDWLQAVHAATARLNEGLSLPEITYHWATAGPAAELAALLCAYGLLAEEVRRESRRAGELPDALPIVTPAKVEYAGATLWCEPPGIALAAGSAPGLGLLSDWPGAGEVELSPLSYSAVSRAGVDARAPA